MLDYQNDKFLSGLCPAVRSQRFSCMQVLVALKKIC